MQTLLYSFASGWLSLYLRISILIVMLLCSTVYAQGVTNSAVSEQTKTKNTELDQTTSINAVSDEPIDLVMFIESVLLKNTELRKKNSQKLFARLVNKPDTNLLPVEVYKSLGFRLRDPFLVQVPEISTRFYTVSDDSDLYFQQLLDLEKNWALLSTTLSRVHDNDKFAKLIEQNVALDAIDLWYRMTNNQQYSQWLAEQKQQIQSAGREVALNKEEFSEQVFGRLKIKNLELLADNTQLNQFFDTEAAYLYARSGSRVLPDSKLERRYDFAGQTFCKPKLKLSELGNTYLQDNHPQLLRIINNSPLKQKVWQLSQSAKDISKKLLLAPQNEELKAANYVLSDLTLSLILQLNQQRLNAYAANKSRFFVQKTSNSTSYEATSRLNELIDFQNDIFELKVMDSFVAGERIASLNLHLLRGCAQVFEGSDRIKEFARFVESHHFQGLNFPVATNVIDALNDVKSAWDGSAYVTVNRSVNESEKTEEVKLLKSTTSVKQPLLKPQLLKQDSIIGASSEQAAILLRKSGFELSTYNEVIALTDDRGYSVQVLTTSSATEAAAKARQLAKSEEVKVYLSSVSVDGVVEKRYKVLVTFFAGRVSAAKFQELVAKANQLKGFLKRYKQIRKDLIR